MRRKSDARKEGKGFHNYRGAWCRLHAVRRHKRRYKDENKDLVSREEKTTTTSVWFCDFTPNPEEKRNKAENKETEEEDIFLPPRY